MQFAMNISEQLIARNSFVQLVSVCVVHAGVVTWLLPSSMPRCMYCKETRLDGCVSEHFLLITYQMDNGYMLLSDVTASSTVYSYSICLHMTSIMQPT